MLIFSAKSVISQTLDRKWSDLTEEKKIKAIKDWKVPTKATKHIFVLGLVYYYLWFIEGYSRRAAPLQTILKRQGLGSGWLNAKPLLKT